MKNIFIIIVGCLLIAGCSGKEFQSSEEIEGEIEKVDTKEAEATEEVKEPIMGVPTALRGTEEGERMQEEIDNRKQEEAEKQDPKGRWSSVPPDTVNNFPSLREKYEKMKEEERERNRVAPTIGMTDYEVRESTWGLPHKINKTTTRYGVSEQAMGVSEL
ncbi:hypothetical protein [Sporosarcina sp. HYO08]|uniref:hypothetical protein n=1 Tax=Sporosarcina sp. HYO08 TaxID=1759557 RepID=UPI0007946AB6|nr:hypothetical protein [Sporosarcina sp. HYO08]KXH82071.1 hypothetical protein AU377_07415 [Sporosarcina sp. HYO08]